MTAQPPSGGCVLKQYTANAWSSDYIQPPSGGCVLKQPIDNRLAVYHPSRLQAAVC